MASAGPADPADVLFAAPLAEFIATRGRLATELSKAGDKQAAAALKAMGKPSVSAWAVNQAVRAEPAAVHRLIRASDALARAQLSGAQQRDRFQDAQAEHRQAVDALVDLAEQVLRDAGQTPNQALRERIAGDLRWGALSEELRPALVAGRLIKDIGAQDFGSLLQKASASPSGPFVVPAARAAPPPKPSPPSKDLTPADRRKAEQQAHRQAREEKERAKRRQEELRALWQEARAATREAHKAEARALAELDRQRREFGKLEAALAEARAQLEEAEAAAQRAGSSRKAAETAERAAEQAHQSPDNDNHGSRR